jgi:hypothetical protein
MVRFTSGLLLLLFTALASAAPAEQPASRKEHQQIILNPSLSSTKNTPRKLQGRFLHITGDAPTALPPEHLLTCSIQTYIPTPSTKSIPILTGRVTPARAKLAIMVQK